MTPVWLKRFAERCLPGPVVRVARGYVRRRADRRLARRVAALRREHDARNAAAPAGALRLRNGVTVRVTPVGREMYEYFCFRDPNNVDEFDAYARLSADKLRLLDVGAEHGFFSLAFACEKPGRRALALEPSPVAYPDLRAQLELNPGAAVTALNLAAGAADGEVQMAIRGNQAVTAFDHYQNLPAERLSVPVRTVDGVCREHGFDPDLMKVDVEGYELFVLRGARTVLDRCSPLLLIELHPYLLETLGQSVADVVGFLAACGYVHVDRATGRPAPVPPPVAGVMRVVFRKPGAAGWPERT